MLDLPRGLQERYHPLGVLGRGAFGQVVHVRDRDLGREAAVKLLVAAEDPTTRKRFVREAQVTAELRHPHVVRIFDAGVTVDREGREVRYIVYEHLAGSDLARWLARHGPASRERLLGWADQLVDALRAAHGRGILHRDLKPSNVLFRRDPAEGEVGELVLCDFGLARRVDHRTFRTTAGKVVGTLPYMAPEVLGGGSSSPASDQYSLGVTLYELATGELPFTRSAILDAASRRRALDLEVPPSLERRAPALAEALRRATRSRPERRFEDLEALQRVLREGAEPAESDGGTLARSPLGASAVRSSASLSRARARPRLRVSVAAAAAALVAAGAVLGVRGRRTAAPRPGSDHGEWLAPAAVPVPWEDHLRGARDGLQVALRGLERILGADPGGASDAAHARAGPLVDPRLPLAARRVTRALGDMIEGVAGLPHATGAPDPWRWRRLVQELRGGVDALGQLFEDLRQARRAWMRAGTRGELLHDPEALERREALAAILDAMVQVEDAARELQGRWRALPRPRHGSLIHLDLFLTHRLEGPRELGSLYEEAHARVRGAEDPVDLVHALHAEGLALAAWIRKEEGACSRLAVAVRASRARARAAMRSLPAAARAGVLAELLREAFLVEVACPRAGTAEDRAARRRLRDEVLPLLRDLSPAARAPLVGMLRNRETYWREPRSADPIPPQARVPEDFDRALDQLAAHPEPGGSLALR